MITTIEEAKQDLQTAIMDVEADMGEEAVEAGYHDIVRNVGDRCTPEIKAELFRREGVEA